MWFIGVEVELETSAPPPKKNPGSAPETAGHVSFQLSITTNQIIACPNRAGRINLIA